MHCYGKWCCSHMGQKWNESKQNWRNIITVWVRVFLERNVTSTSVWCFNIPEQKSTRELSDELFICLPRILQQVSANDKYAVQSWLACYEKKSEISGWKSITYLVKSLQITNGWWNLQIIWKLVLEMSNQHPKLSAPVSNVIKAKTQIKHEEKLLSFLDHKEDFKSFW